MRVTIIAHASVLVEMGRQRILVDPVFADVFASDTLCFHPPRCIDEQALIDRTTTLALSHIHLDHYHSPTLMRFPRHLPVILPPHAALIQEVRQLGFERLIVLQPWQRHDTGESCLTATPSDFEIDEFGLVFSHGDTHYWHMSDAIVDPTVGRRLLEDIGTMSLVAVKYQPLRTLIGYQRGLQSSMLDRDELIAGLETACATRPAFVFPYFSGFAFHGEHAWANRHIAPYTAAEIARWLRRRLPPDSRVETVLPGDLLAINGRSVKHEIGAADFVATAPGPPVESWEPVDVSTLPGLATPAERTWLTLEVERLMATEIMPWLLAHLGRRSGLFDTYREFGAIWQGSIHLDADRRLEHAIDFRQRPAQLLLNCRHVDANVFSHIGARDLLRVLRGESGAEVFWMAGGYRMYEKLLFLEDDRFQQPPLPAWDLYESLPDPITHYLRRHGRRRPRISNGYPAAGTPGD